MSEKIKNKTKLSSIFSAPVVFVRPQAFTNKATGTRRRAQPLASQSVPGAQSGPGPREPALPRSAEPVPTAPRCHLVACGWRAGSQEALNPGSGPVCRSKVSGAGCGERGKGHLERPRPAQSGQETPANPELRPTACHLQ